MDRKRTRRYFWIAVAAAVALFLLYAFWPRPLPVDMAAVVRAPMIVTIDEEARTRVHEEYVISAPISGRLLRVDVHPGDRVERQQTIVARIAPSDPAFLDARSRTEAEAAARAAEAGLRLAEAELQRARAEETYARAEAERVRELAKTDFVSQAAVDRAELSLSTARAGRESVQAAVRMRTAELETARARLLPPDEGEGAHAQVLPIRSPVSGSVLRVLEESETVVQAGAPIISIGDPQDDLEIVAELLSADAVQVRLGARVVVENWGGPPLAGVVERVEPYGFRKISALGVEEQRVNVVIGFDDDAAARAGLGHGFRVDVRIVVWENADALTAPSSSLFRDDGGWAAFVVENGRAKKRRVLVGRNNGVQAEILEGLEASAVVVEYPGDRIEDGRGVAARGG